jgi:hypothetical protein
MRKIDLRYCCGFLVTEIFGASFRYFEDETKLANIELQGRHGLRGSPYKRSSILCSAFRRTLRTQNFKIRVPNNDKNYSKLIPILLGS